MPRYVVCNADEGEPGTFKDRVLLNSHADLVFDGMTVAAYAVGARHGLLYLRGEYRYLLAHLQACSTGGAARACSGRASAAGRASTSTSRSISVPAPMSAARSPP